MSESKENINKATDKTYPESKTKEAEKSKHSSKPKHGLEPYAALLDISFSLSKLIVIIIGLFTAGVSVVSGATLIAASLRGALAILALGIIFWLINWILSTGSMNATVKDIMAKIEKTKQAQNEEDVTASTVIKSA